MSSGGFSRFARRPPSKPTNENAVNNNTQSTALDSAPPEDSTAPSASEFSFGSSWDSSGGFVEQSGGDWLDEGFWETVEPSHIKPNESQKNQGGFVGVPLFKSKTKSPTGASSTTTPETTTAPTPASLSGAATKTPVQASTAPSFSASSAHFHHDTSVSKSSTAGREGETGQQTALTSVATPHPYSAGERGQIVARNNAKPSFKHTGLEQGASAGVDESEPSEPKAMGVGVASANPHHIDKRSVTVHQYDSNKTPGPTAHPINTQALSVESTGNTESTAAFDSQYPPPVTPATTEKFPNNETPFRGTLSQFDTSLVSPEHGTDTTAEMSFSSNEKTQTSGNLGGSELSLEAISEETFSQIFLSIKNHQLAFDDGNSAYDDQWLELSSVLCFEHSDMLTFEASYSEQTEEVDNVFDLLENAIASLNGAS